MTKCARCGWDELGSDLHHACPSSGPSPLPVVPVGEAAPFYPGDRVSVPAVDGSTQFGRVHPTVVPGAPRVPVVDDRWGLVSYYEAHTLTLVTGELGAA